MDIQIVLSSVITLFIPFNIFIVVILIKSKIKIYVDSNLSGERFYLVLLNFFFCFVLTVVDIKGVWSSDSFLCSFQWICFGMTSVKIEFKMRGYFKSEFWLKFSLSFFLSKIVLDDVFNGSQKSLTILLVSQVQIFSLNLYKIFKNQSKKLFHNVTTAHKISLWHFWNT